MWRVYHSGVVPLEDLPTWKESWCPRLGDRADPRTLISRLLWAWPERSTRSLNRWRFIVYVFYQYLVKEASSRRSPLCLPDDDEFTKEGSRCSPPIPNLQYDVAQFHSCFMIWWFVLSSLKLKFWGDCRTCFEFGGKSWVSLLFGFDFTLTLDMRWEIG